MLKSHGLVQLARNLDLKESGHERTRTTVMTMSMCAVVL